jgi:hypothetical protein
MSQHPDFKSRVAITDKALSTLMTTIYLCFINGYVSLIMGGRSRRMAHLFLRLIACVSKAEQSGSAAVLTLSKLSKQLIGQTAKLSSNQATNFLIEHNCLLGRCTV